MNNRKGVLTFSMKTIYNLSLVFLFTGYAIYFLTAFYFRVFDEESGLVQIFKAAHYSSIIWVSFSCVAFIGLTIHMIKVGKNKKKLALIIFALIPSILFYL